MLWQPQVQSSLWIFPFGFHEVEILEVEAVVEEDNMEKQSPRSMSHNCCRILRMMANCIRNLNSVSLTT